MSKKFFIEVEMKDGSVKELPLEEARPLLEQREVVPYRLRAEFEVPTNPRIEEAKIYVTDDDDPWDVEGVGIGYKVIYGEYIRPNGIKTYNYRIFLSEKDAKEFMNNLPDSIPVSTREIDWRELPDWFNKIICYDEGALFYK